MCSGTRLLERSIEVTQTPEPLLNITRVDAKKGGGKEVELFRVCAAVHIIFVSEV